MGVVVGGGLAFEVGEEVVAQIELDLARGADDDLAGDVEEDRGERGDQEQAQAVVDDFGVSDALAHIVDGVADDEGKNDADEIVGDHRDASPGEIFPVALEVRKQRSNLIKHAEDFSRQGGLR